MWRKTLLRKLPTTLGLLASPLRGRRNSPSCSVGSKPYLQFVPDGPSWPSEQSGSLSEQL